MQSLGGKRKTVWEREAASNDISPHDMDYLPNLFSKRPKFKEIKQGNLGLDVYSKIGLLKASPSVVGLVSYSGKEEFIQGSGTIIDSNVDSSTVLTSANLIRRPTCEEFVENKLLDNLKVTVHTCHDNSYDGEVIAHDFYYNLAAIRFKSETPLATATLAHVDDSVSIASIQPSFQLRAHSRSSNLVPGDKVIALGRSAKDFEIMVAPGEHCHERPDSEYDCRELFSTNCIITRSGDGGPLINYNGEVIGVMYYDFGLLPWMPINIVCKWWEHYKRFGEYRRPALGVEASNLYAADVCIIERMMLKFPGICKGVFIEKVVPGSSADLAGIRADDVIVKCGGKTVQGFLELRAHSRSSNLVPGDKVITLGRSANDFEIMVAPGEYCLERPDSEYDCRELFLTNCIITRSGDGGPLINYNGEVIGVTYYDFGLRPWMPINIVCKWWEHYKRFGEYRRPALGVEATNLYAADVCIIERMMLKFPGICKGVFIEKVVPGSSADLAGIRPDDVIVTCGGKTVQSFLEFFETIWDKVGNIVELVIVRPGNVTHIHLKMHVEGTSDHLTRWPSRFYK